MKWRCGCAGPGVIVRLAQGELMPDHHDSQLELQDRDANLLPKLLSMRKLWVTYGCSMNKYISIMNYWQPIIFFSDDITHIISPVSSLGTGSEKVRTN